MKSPFREKNVFLQNYVIASSEPGRLVHVMMSWFHHGFTSSPSSDVWSSSAMMTSEWDDPAALASLPADQLSTSPRYSSSRLFLTTLHCPSLSSWLIATLHHCSSSILFITTLRRYQCSNYNLSFVGGL